jgi:formylglycine-generating enzyme required for sulfatase activity
MQNYQSLFVFLLVAISSFGQEVDGLTPVQITNSVSMVLVAIKPGSFTMGSPLTEPERDRDEAPHKVTITKRFFMGATHVTKKHFAAFVKDAKYQTDAEKRGWALAITVQRYSKVKGASWHNAGYRQNDDHPVVEISWDDAVAFCQWLSRKEGRKYRLPTEAEWEYCCRAGTQTTFLWGNSPDDGKGWANCSDATLKTVRPVGAFFNWADGEVFTSSVGKFKANAWGLYDMIGNTSQWCSDWYAEYENGVSIDPAGPAKAPDSRTADINGPGRVLRGGSWFHVPRGCRCSSRIHMTPDGANFFSGFRVVLQSN